MVEWKVYTITRVYIEFDGFNGKSVAKFFLDDYVCYRNGNYKNLVIYNDGSFIPYQVGDCIEINLDRMRSGAAYNADNDDTISGAFSYNLIRDYVRKVGSKAVAIGYSESDINCLKNRISELEKQKDINRELVSMLNNFSQRMISENFTSNSYFIEYDLDNCRQKLNKIVKSVETKSEEQTALVTRNSTDLSVTQETLRLTQVANLVLQKQISDNKEDHQQKLDDKNKQIEEKKEELKQGLELYKKKEDEVRDLNKKNNGLKDKNAELREEKSATEIKLQRREEEVDELRGKLGQTEEEFLENKIRLKQERLELFADRLEVNLEKIQNLREYFEGKINARSINDRKEVEKKITQTKQELRSKIKMEDVQEICSRCEEIAELQIKLEKLQLHGQQYQARQEQPTNQ